MATVYKPRRESARVQRQVIVRAGSGAGAAQSPSRHPPGPLRPGARIMALMSSSEELLRQARNQGPSVPKRPRRRTAVIACMDTRVDPWKIVGAEVGDVHTIRNAGAIVTDDVVRSLIASTQMLAVDRVQVVMHTDCGMQGLTQQVVEEQLGPVPYDFGGFVSLEDELQRGVERLRSEPLIDAPKGITGYVYHIDTGELRLVVP